MSTRIHRVGFAVIFGFLAVMACRQTARAADWPMYGRDATGNPVSPEKNPPTDWQIERRSDKGVVETPARNIRWSAQLGSNSIGGPVVAGGLVWVCTNNEGRRDPQLDKDAAVLTCFDEADGRFRWQSVTPREGNRVHDWPFSCAGSPPLVEGDRLYCLTNRWEVVCLDIRPLLRRTGEPRQLWRLDMPRDLGVFGKSPGMAFDIRCPITASHDCRLYVTTGNGVDETYRNVPAPEAPALICVEKETGKVVWKDNSPGKEILDLQVASPLAAEINGKVLVIAPQGDGWVRAFDAATGRPVWWFDANPKAAVWPNTRNQVMARPVLHDGLLYITTGQCIEHGSGNGLLWCIDPTKAGDISAELDDGPLPPPPPDGAAAADSSPLGRPRRGKPNPDSAVVWKFDHQPAGPGVKVKSLERMHRTGAPVAVANGLVIATDTDGFVHCLDARTGKQQWNYDAEADIWGPPLLCDGKVYVGDGNGKVHILELGRQLKLLGSSEFDQGITGGPVFANGVLYVMTRDRLFAIREEPAAAASPTIAPSTAPATRPAESDWPQWRGPGRTNVAPDNGLLAEWPAEGPPLLWRADGVGEGVPSVAVAAGRVYTLGYRNGSEFLTTWDAATGEQSWTARVGPAVAEMISMRWLSQRTPTVDGDRVYVATARGELICLSTNGGAELWRKDYKQDFAGRPGSWGFCDYPLVDGDHLICTPGGPDASVVALDKRTGAIGWKCAVSGVRRATYSAPVIAELAGVRQYVQQFDTGVVGIGTDGALLWRYDGIQDSRGNVHTAIPVGADAVFSSCGWGVGDALLGLAAADGRIEVVERYRNRDGRRPQAFPAWLGNSSLLGDHVFTNGGSCLELKTGHITWSNPFDRVTMVVADGRLYYRLTDGTIVLAEANPEKFVERGRFLPPRAQTKEPAWSSPVIAGGRLYLRDQDELLCYDLRRDRTAPFVPLPPAPAATRPAAAATRPATAPAIERVGHDAIFLPTPQDVVERMLEVAAARKDDVVYDLGCGDGRIVVAAARRYGCRAVGVDIDAECVRLSNENVVRHKVEGLVTIEKRDLFTVDLAGASVVALYVGRDVNRRLLPQLEKLKAGSRVVSHNFEIEGYEPDKVDEMKSAETDTRHTIYLYTAPLKKRR